jgi:tripeptide aminopeptidase
MIDAAIAELLALLAIPGPPAQEMAVADFLVRALAALGVPPERIYFDQAHQQSEYGGEVGNLFVHLPGGRPGPHLLFSAHMDTVPLAVGCQPRLDSDGRRIVNDSPNTALGGDNRTGCALLLALARALAHNPAGHPPVTLLFFVQEEVGLVGSRDLDVARLPDPRPTMGFNFDSESPAIIINRVTGTERFWINVEGVAAHAGSEPEAGISAAVIAAEAIAALAAAGWHGRIIRPDGRGSANVGIMRGGQGSNIVMPELELLVEARSHDRLFRRRIIQEWEGAFARVVAAAHNPAGAHGQVHFSPGPTYESFAIPDGEPVVTLARQAARHVGLEPEVISDDGGMDANWMVAHGIPTVTLGCGMRQIHTPSEWVDLADWLKACELALAIVQMAAAENGP